MRPISSGAIGLLPGSLRSRRACSLDPVARAIEIEKRSGAGRYRGRVPGGEAAHRPEQRVQLMAGDLKQDPTVSAPRCLNVRTWAGLPPRPTTRSSGRTPVAVAAGGQSAAVGDRETQMRDAGLEIVLEAGHGVGQLPLVVGDQAVASGAETRTE
jgi:hypothetical protein